MMTGGAQCLYIFPRKDDSWKAIFLSGAMLVLYFMGGVFPIDSGERISILSWELVSPIPTLKRESLNIIIDRGYFGQFLRTSGP